MIFDIKIYFVLQFSSIYRAMSKNFKETSPYIQTHRTIVIGIEKADGRKETNEEVEEDICKN